MDFFGNVGLDKYLDSMVIDGNYWLGDEVLETPNATSVQWVRVASVAVVGTFIAFLFFLCFKAVHFLSMRFFKPYKSLRFVAKVDWTSRWVAMIFIVFHLYTWLMTWECQHPLHPMDNEEKGRIWHMQMSVDRRTMYWAFVHFATIFGYELYDLKNCVDIKMPSGVLHHLVLLMVLPPMWYVTRMTSFAIAMGAITYISNFPAHMRSFMAHMGMRGGRLYELNKSLWWYSYVVCRLFLIPWFSSQVWYLRSAVVEQSNVYALSIYFFAVIVHYGLSVYWFHGMTKTFIKPVELKRVDSYPILRRKKPGDAEDDDDDGGQKFD